jgi:orsellinic acid C2-O-methyltransferase
MTPDARKLFDLITGSWIAQVACVAAELGIPDLLRDGPMSNEDLAAVTDSHAPSLQRLLRALVTLDLCRERDDGLFEVTEMGSLLSSDAPQSLRHWAIWWGAHLGPVWQQLVYSIRTGKSARALITGMEGFEHLERDPESAAVFHRALVEVTRLSAGAVVAAYDFSRARRIVDVGGGYGELLAAILRANPAASGVLFDLAHASDGARRLFQESNLGGRCEFVAGDFLDSVPTGGDAYLLKSVIHDWDDIRAARILMNCRAAMTQASRLLLVEQVMPDRLSATAAHQSVACSDLNMLVAHGARERTEREHRGLLRSAGLDVTSILPTSSSFTIIEAQAS